jgi:hypothetical protein
MQFQSAQILRNLRQTDATGRWIGAGCRRQHGQISEYGDHSLIVIMAKRWEDEGACWSRQQFGTRPSREFRVFVAGIKRSVSLAGMSYVPNEQQFRTFNARVVIRDERWNVLRSSAPCLCRYLPRCLSISVW